MPRVPGLTQEQKIRQKERDDAARIVKSLTHLKTETGIRSDATFAEMLGMTYARYRKIKDNPMSLRLTEMRDIQRQADRFGISVYLGLEVSSA